MKHPHFSIHIRYIEKFKSWFLYVEDSQNNVLKLDAINRQTDNIQNAYELAYALAHLFLTSHCTSKIKLFLDNNLERVFETTPLSV